MFDQNYYEPFCHREVKFIGTSSSIYQEASFFIRWYSEKSWVRRALHNYWANHSILNCKSAVKSLKVEMRATSGECPRIPEGFNKIGSDDSNTFPYKFGMKRKKTGTSYPNFCHTTEMFTLNIRYDASWLNIKATWNREILLYLVCYLFPMVRIRHCVNVWSSTQYHCERLSVSHRAWQYLLDKTLSNTS